MSDSVIPWAAAHQGYLSSLSPWVSSTHVHWVSDAIQPSLPLSSPSPPAFNFSQHQGLSQCVGSSHQVAIVLELKLQHQSFKWIFRIDFFRIDWFDLLVVQGTLKCLLQHHSLKVTILQLLVSFTVQLSHSYIITRKTTAFTIWTFVGKVMSLLFKALSRFDIAVLPRSNRLLILWLQH